MNIVQLGTYLERTDAAETTGRARARNVVKRIVESSEGRPLTRPAKRKIEKNWNCESYLFQTAVCLSLSTWRLTST